MYSWIALTLFVALPAELSLDELIARHTKAGGGRAAIEAVRAIELELRIVEPTFAVDAHYCAARPGRMRIDVSAEGERVFTEAYAGQAAWQWEKGKGVQDVSPEGTAALRHGTQFPGTLFGLHELAANGHHLALLGRETLDGVSYHVLELTLSDGFVTHYYLDPTTYLLARRRDFRALHPDVDATKKWLEDRWTDYREVGGMMRAFTSSQVDVRTGEILQTTTLKSVRVSRQFEEAVFQKP
jgi:hypothetical protein